MVLAEYTRVDSELRERVRRRSDARSSMSTSQSDALNDEINALLDERNKLTAR